MLGEDHSLVNEFPEFKELIAELSNNYSSFLDDVQNYNRLDAEIRNLELENSPIEDMAMHQLKHERAVLKDRLYQWLVSVSK